MIYRLKNSYWLCLTVILIALIGLLSYFVYDHSQSTQKQTNQVFTDKITDTRSANIHIRYRFSLKNRSAQAINNAKFSFFAPHQNETRQALSHYDISEPYQLIHDNHQNYSFEINELFIPPYGTKMVTANITVTRKLGKSRLENREQYLQKNLQKYLQNGHYLNMDDTLLIALAKQLRKSDPYQSAKAIYLWLINNIESINYIAKAKGARFAIQHRKGDCTEMMHAFIALARLNNIPARAMGGFVIEGNTGIINPDDYHNWAEYYNGKRWVIVDPYEQVFDHTGNRHYISFRYLDNLTAKQADTQRFISSEAAIKVSMN